MANELIPPKQFFEELDRSCESKIAACERQVNELAEIRDVLLAALNGIVNFHNENCEDEELYPEFLEHLNICKAAIAKASQ
jgi:hypothetical protein